MCRQAPGCASHYALTGENGDPIMPATALARQPSRTLVITVTVVPLALAALAINALKGFRQPRASIKERMSSTGRWPSLPFACGFAREPPDSP
ncbi:hypothetical protein GCM10010309_79310 [Streptomyces violaceochromogenes]|nr:hypothetical protein GCM10010309_79310 [Streptomyces violaceochromogenes]